MKLLSESKPCPTGGSSRREFVQELGTLVPAMAALPGVTGAATEQLLVPQIRLGRHSISRLIMGSNPVVGTSHLSNIVDTEMRQWHTTEQLGKNFNHCQDLGINCFENGTLPAIPLFWDQGGKMSFAARGVVKLVDYGKRDPVDPKDLAKSGWIAIHHAGFGPNGTDSMFRTRQLAKVREHTKRVRDAGVLVGVGSHIPEAIEEIESQDWDVDYYMTCVYRWGRTREELEKLFAFNPDLMPVEAYHTKNRVWETYGGDEIFLRGDPPRMYKTIKQVKKPCLAYKILAAGRLCEKPEFVEAAFKEAFENIKPTDAVVVGMWDKQKDQFAQNAECVRRFGSNAASKASASAE